MRNLRWIRKTVNTGIVEKVQHDGTWVQVLPESSIPECCGYVIANKAEWKLYKIATISERKNAVRHLAEVIYAADDDDAKNYFSAVICGKYPEGTVQLVTGDWKIIAVRNGADAPIVII